MTRVPALVFRLLPGPRCSVRSPTPAEMNVILPLAGGRRLVAAVIDLLEADDLEHHGRAVRRPQPALWGSR